MPRERKKPAQNSRDEDYDTAMEMAAIIAANLAAAAKESPNPKKFTQKLLRTLKSDTRMAEAYLAINIPNLEVERPYKVESFLKIVKSYFESITDSQLSRALDDLTADFRIEHLTGKKNIKDKTKGKMRLQFDGTPSAYLLPSKVSSIKRVYENKDLVDKILNVLQESGVLHNSLMHRVLPALQVMQKDTEGRYKQLLSALFPTLTLSQLDNFMKVLLTSNDEQLEKLASGLIKVFQKRITEVPGFGQAILILGFRKFHEIE